MTGADPTPHDYPTEGFGLDQRHPTAPRSTTELVKEAAAVVPQLISMVYRLLRDPSVPVRRKVLSAVALGYVVSPIDLVPDVIPVLGQIDDLIMLALAVHLLIESVPEETQAAYWDGGDDALELVRAILGWGAEFVPQRLRRYVS